MGNTQDRATDDGDEEAWERSLVEAPRRSFGARAAVVTVATLACGAFAAIASTHATGGEVSLFASALGSNAARESRATRGAGKTQSREQARTKTSEADEETSGSGFAEDSSEKAEEETKDDGRQTSSKRCCGRHRREEIGG